MHSHLYEHVNFEEFAEINEDFIADLKHEIDDPDFIEQTLNEINDPEFVEKPLNEIN